MWLIVGLGRCLGRGTQVMFVKPALLVTVGYLLGSIPFAWLLARRAGGIDIRLAGSGNVGAANVYRTTGAAVAMAVVTLDMAKGACAVMLASRADFGVGVQAIAGVAAVIGHVYPVWLGFRGGKGVATACGVFAVLAPAATVLAGIAFVATVWWTRYVSVGSVGAAILLPPLAYLLAAPFVVVMAASLCAAVIIGCHRANLARLQAGTERRLGQSPWDGGHTP
jgi:acyl phosphate:glycerol-3-phosphate acyltransferase